FTFHVLDGKVTSSSTQNFQNNVTARMSFRGTIENNVITGRMTMQIDPVQSAGATSYMNIVTDDHITLHQGGRVTIDGTSHSTWRVVGKDRSTSGSNSEPVKAAGNWSLKSKADK
ncbi:MAG: hypothetical protein Q8M07_22145, partial [Prosthecobacter sp.]|nr:hypothetical protein [Prosthecobacter sp.]